MNTNNLWRCECGQYNAAGRHNCPCGKCRLDHVFEPGPTKADAALMQPMVKPQQKTKPTKPEDRLNNLERRFWERLKTDGYDTLHVQTITFRIGDDCRYTPDFIAYDSLHRTTAWEVKGPHVWEDSIVKLKAAATIYPWVAWHLCKWDKEQSKWDIRRIGV